MVTYLKLFWYVIIFSAVACWFLYYLLHSRQISKWEKSNIPFLRPVLLLGHKYLLNAGVSIVAALDRIHWENYHKDLIGFFIGPQPVIMLKDVKLIKQIFVKNSDKTFCTHVLTPHDDIETQSTIPLCSDRTRWKSGRSALSPMFRKSSMGGAHFEKFEKHMKRILDQADEAHRSNQPMLVPEIAHNFVLDSTIWWLFDEDKNSVDQSEAHQAYNTFFDMSIWGLLRCYLVAFYPGFQKLGFQKFRPFKVFPQMCFDNMRRLVERKIKNWTNNQEQDNFVYHLAALKENGVLAKPNAAQDLDFETQNETILREITGYAWTSLIGGADPQIAGIISVIHLLSLYPEYQEKIKTEIDQVMKNHGVSKLSFEVIQDLRFTEQCVYEAARLVPISPFLARRCSEDFQVSGTNYTFRKGDLLIVCMFSMNHDPKHFENPEEFHPERFDSYQSLSSIPSDVLLSFGAGPRKCPGYNAGITLIVMFVAALIFKYQLRPRSHLKQMTTPADFFPNSASITIKGDLLVDLRPL